MAITECPMCQTSIPVEGTKSCLSCGADLTRWMPKSAAPPIIQAANTATALGNDAAEASLGRGILGAAAGAVGGSVLMYGFFLTAGFRFPLLGVGIGLLTGLGAKWLNKGADEKLGMISAGLAMAATFGTLYLIYGEFQILNLISVVISASVAYRRASS
jgi:hypothetical protein